MADNLRIYDYDPSPKLLAKLTLDLKARTISADGNYRLVVVSGRDALSNLARKTEREIFDKAFGDITPHTPEVMHELYGEDEDNSIFFMVYAQDSFEVVGVMRLILSLIHI